MTTIKDIADAAGVSRGTVDRVLHNRQGVSRKVRESVLKALEELNYRPNSVAKALATRKCPKTIHVIVAPTFNPFVDEILEGIGRAESDYADYGLRIRVHALSAFDRNEQLSMLDDIMKGGCDGLALVPVASTAITNAINNISESGVPVVIYNSEMPDAKSICFVGQDQFKSGQTAGALMNMAVRKGKVCVILAMTDLSCHQSRMKGFKKELSRDISVFSVANNDDKDELAYKATLKFLEESGNKIDGIYITGGGIAGLVRALAEKNMAGKVKVISHDITPVAQEFLKSGALHFTLGQDPQFQGYKSVSVLFDYLYRDIMPEQKSIYTNIDIKMKTNIN
jgi:LacI family transcriptional regulator